MTEQSGLTVEEAREVIAWYTKAVGKAAVEREIAEMRKAEKKP